MDSRCKITKKHLFITCNYFEMQSYTRFFNAEIPKSGYFSIFPFQPIIINLRPPN